MKVFDLRCTHAHTFEGWFASEEDFASQTRRGLVLCPVCGDSGLQKLLSAPRLNLGAGMSESASAVSDPATTAPPAMDAASAFLEFARKIVSSTTDVGARFAEEARKMHYGEAPERAIRGQATLPEAHALLEEGIDVLPVFLPDVFKGTVQ